MREGKRMEKRMIRGKRRGNGERKQGGGQREKLDGKRVGEENDEEEGRGEVIGVCLYICFFLPLSNTVDVGSDYAAKGKGVTGLSEGHWNR